MKYNCYAIRDSKCDFHTPTFSLNDASASRDFAMIVNQPDNLISFSPADFSLYRVGTFDSASGIFTPEALPTLVVSASSLISIK